MKERGLGGNGRKELKREVWESDKREKTEETDLFVCVCACARAWNFS